VNLLCVHQKRSAGASKTLQARTTSHAGYETGPRRRNGSRRCSAGATSSVGLAAVELRSLDRAAPFTLAWLPNPRLRSCWREELPRLTGLGFLELA
jgi:hypothetical protein